MAKVADDLYIGGDTPEELLGTWEKVLSALQRCDLNLSAAKTIIAPKCTSILGWIWELGTIRANPHRVSTLSALRTPTNVSGMLSFIGAYKVLARVIKGSASLMAPLYDVVAGRDSKELIVWTDELRSSFKKSQDASSTNCSITLPRAADQLWIVTDGSVKNLGLGATLYVTRGSRVLLAGFF